MIRTNYHTHNDLCDGKGTLEDYVRTASEKGFTALGFSSHAPVPFETDWHLTEENLVTYLSEIRRLKDVWKDKVQVYAGLEIDYISGLQAPSDPRWKSLGLDYRIGSAHNSVSLDANPEYACVDGPIDGVMRLLDSCHGGSWEDMSGEYYHRVAELIQLGGFDILGHLDLIKKHNRGDVYFRESDPWYRRQVLEVLDVLSGKGIIMEVNSGAISRGALDAVYPSPWILAEARKKQIPVMVNADAHRPEHIDYHFEESCLLLRDCGYREIRALIDGKWTSLPL